MENKKERIQENEKFGINRERKLREKKIGEKERNLGKEDRRERELREEAHGVGR